MEAQEAVEIGGIGEQLATRAEAPCPRDDDHLLFSASWNHLGAKQEHQQHTTTGFSRNKLVELLLKLREGVIISAHVILLNGFRWHAKQRKSGGGSQLCTVLTRRAMKDCWKPVLLGQR